MNYLINHNRFATGAWIVLLGLTLFSYQLSIAGYVGKIFVLSVLATSLVKGQIIIERFMMLKAAPLMWRLIISLWLIIVLAVIASMYYAFG